MSMHCCEQNSLLNCVCTDAKLSRRPLILSGAFLMQIRSDIEYAEQDPTLRKTD